MLVSRHCRLISFGLVAIVSQSALHGQQTNVTGSRSNGAVAVSSDHGIDVLETQLSKLMETTARLRKQLESEIPPAAEDHARERTIPAGGEHAALDAATSRIREIRERIKLLRKMRQRNVLDPDGNTHVEVHMADHPTASGEHHPSLVAIEQSLSNHGTPGEQPEPVTPATIEATKVLAGPVNTLELGQSLYRTKNYTAALQALESVAVDTLSDSDRHWLELLIALCQRRLGQIDVAEARLREIANTNSADYPIPVARWWLKQTSLLRNARPILDDISAELDTLIERSKPHAQQ
jgi:TolA-binding protein